MKKIHQILSLLAGVVLLGAGPAMAAPNLKGSWNITFYLEPDHSESGTQCIVFTQTGGVAGEKVSGTWTSPTFAGWQGQWIQEGDHLRWYGFTGSLATAESTGFIASKGSMSGEFMHFSAPGVTSTTGAWIGKKVGGCSGAAKTSHAGGDPSKK